jgi:hypothetical protein
VAALSGSVVAPFVGPFVCSRGECQLVHVCLWSTSSCASAARIQLPAALWRGGVAVPQDRRGRQPAAAAGHARRALPAARVPRLGCDEIPCPSAAWIPCSCCSRPAHQVVDSPVCLPAMRCSQVLTLTAAVALPRSHGGGTGCCQDPPGQAGPCGPALHSHKAHAEAVHCRSRAAGGASAGDVQGVSDQGAEQGRGAAQGAVWERHLAPLGWQNGLDCSKLYQSNLCVHAPCTSSQPTPVYPHVFLTRATQQHR